MMDYHAIADAEAYPRLSLQSIFISEQLSSRNHQPSGNRTLLHSGVEAHAAAKSLGDRRRIQNAPGFGGEGDRTDVDHGAVYLQLRQLNGKSRLAATR